MWKCQKDLGAFASCKMPWVRNLMQPLESCGPRTEHWGTFQQRRAHDCHCREHGTAPCSHQQRVWTGASTKSIFFYFKYKIFSIGKIGIQSASPQKQRESFWSSPLPKKGRLNRGYITFYKLFIPSLSKKRSAWAHRFLWTAGGGRGE